MRVVDAVTGHRVPRPGRRARWLAVKAAYGGGAVGTLGAAGYALLRTEAALARKTIGEPFGWAKTVGPMAQTMRRGVKRVGARFTCTMAACNLARLPRLLAA